MASCNLPCCYCCELMADTLCIFLMILTCLLWVVTGCLALPTECLPRWTEWTGKNGLHEKEDEGV